MSLAHDKEGFVENFQLSHAPLSHVFHVDCYLVSVHRLASDGIVLLHLALNLSDDPADFIGSDVLELRATFLQA